MVRVLDKLYYKLRKEEIDKASTKLKKIKIDTILHNLTRICWKNNIRYDVIIKNGEVLIIVLSGYSERVLFKYHKVDLVSKKEMDFFLNEVDEYKANRGVYITTGEFEKNNNNGLKKLLLKNDISFEDSFLFIKGQLGMNKKASDSFLETKLNLFKYLPR